MLTWTHRGRPTPLDIHARHLTENVLNVNCTGHLLYEEPFDSHGDSQTSWEWNCEMRTREVYVKRNWWLCRTSVSPDNLSTDYGFPVIVVYENGTVYRNWKPRDYVLNGPVSYVRVQLTSKVVIDVSVFTWFKFVNWYQFIPVMSEHLMHLKIFGSTLFDDI